MAWSVSDNVSPLKLEQISKKFTSFASAASVLQVMSARLIFCKMLNIQRDVLVRQWLFSPGRGGFSFFLPS
jgi:hypothetical protein